MQWVLLWTDGLMLLLAAAVGLLVIHILRHQHLRRPWRQVFQRPLAMAAGVVLGAFVLVGLSDSVHVRLALSPASTAGGQAHAVAYSGEILSLLDLALSPIRTGVETSYSAPLAAYGSVRETRFVGDRVERDFPRLKFGAAHLERPAGQRLPDLRRRFATALALALMVWLAIGASMALLLARRADTESEPVAPALALRRTLFGGWALPWHVMLGVIGIIATGIAVTWLVGFDYHLLGTDKVGQDVYYQAIKGIRTGLVIGTLTTLVMLPFALWLGVAAGYFRGWVDDVVQYLYTTLSSIPGVLLIASAVLLLQLFMARNPEMFDNLAARADMRLLFLCLILGVTSWTSLCRLLRGETLKLREVEYVQAAQAFGVGHGRIIARHILPNVMHIILITVVLDFSSLVLAEAVLSYIGIGVDPTTHSWGNMINAARLEMAREPVVWWPLVAAFLFMFLLVLSANLFADAVRDAFDPRTTHHD